MRRTGAITFNGQKLNKRFKRQIGFVMQASSMLAACQSVFVPQLLSVIHNCQPNNAMCVCLLCFCATTVLLAALYKHGRCA